MLSFVTLRIALSFFKFWGAVKSLARHPDLTEGGVRCSHPLFVMGSDREEVLEPLKLAPCKACNGKTYRINIRATVCDEQGFQISVAKDHICSDFTAG